MTLQKIVLLGYSVFLVITPINPSWYTLLVESTGWIIGVTSIYILYLYYKSGPPSKHTSLNTIMRLMMVVIFMLQTRHLLWSFIFNGFPEETRYIFHTHPTLICSILSTRFFELPVVFTFFAILILKCWLTLFPYNFIHCNHEMISKVIVVAVVCGICFEVYHSIVVYGTLCPKSFITTLNTLHEYELDEDSYRRSSILLPFLMIVGVIAETASRIYTKVQMSKKKHFISNIQNEFSNTSRVLPLRVSDVNNGKHLSQLFIIFPPQRVY